MLIKCTECSYTYETQRPKRCSDGVFRCKTCSAKLRNKRYNHSNKGKRISVAYRKRNSTRIVKRVTQWTEENPERRKDIERKYRQTEKGKESAQKRDYRHYWADPEYQRKKAIARNHGTTPDFIEELRTRQPVCQLCGVDKNLTVDHMNPVNNGGKATRENIQSLCGPCNSWKSDNLFLANGSGYMVGESYGRA